MRLPLQYLRNKSPHSFFITPTTSHEVSDTIGMLKKVKKSLETSKSIGPNSISLKLLKLLSPNIAFPHLRL